MHVLCMNQLLPAQALPHGVLIQVISAEIATRWRVHNSAQALPSGILRAATVLPSAATY